MIFSYGWDAPLQEYFFEKADLKAATPENDEGYVYQISSDFSLTPHPEQPNKMNYNRQEILDLVAKEETALGQKIMDDEHKRAIAEQREF